MSLTAARDLPADSTGRTESPVRSTRRFRLARPLLMVGGVAAALTGAAFYWLQGGRVVSIDNAYVRAAKLAIATDVSGTVATIAVADGQRVRAGDVLFRLDPRRFEIALAGARANLDQVALSVSAMKHDYQRMLRDIDVRQAQVQSDQSSFDRFANLVRGGSVTRSDYDDARFRLAAGRAAAESLAEQARVQLARLGGSADIDAAATPQYQQARAQVDEAQRQLDRSVVHAPFDAVTTQVEALQPGQYLAAATAAFGLISTDRVWIEANPKETDITHVVAGASVAVSVDTYPGRIWHGIVESIAPNSGSEFSVLPAQNASGNWVKVVQRIPLRIKVDRKAGDPDLRAGMSVVVDIDTGHVRHLADLIAR